MKIGIDVYVKWKREQYGLRRWSAVPRLGDLMAINVDGQLQNLEVTEVVWGTTPVSREDGDAEVAIMLDRPRGG